MKSTHEIAGQIARDEISRRGLSQAEAATAAGMSRATLVRMFNGNPKVLDETLRAVEGAAALPTRFLTYVIDGNIERLSAIDLRPDLRDLVMYELAHLDDDEAAVRQGVREALSSGRTKKVPISTSRRADRRD
jgi:transcriptional regulator with XRE-family HTH domain